MKHLASHKSLRSFDVLIRRTQAKDVEPETIEFDFKLILTTIKMTCWRTTKLVIYLDFYDCENMQHRCSVCFYGLNTEPTCFELVDGRQTDQLSRSLRKTIFERPPGRLASGIMTAPGSHRLHIPDPVLVRRIKLFVKYFISWIEFAPKMKSRRKTTFFKVFCPLGFVVWNL